MNRDLLSSARRALRRWQNTATTVAGRVRASYEGRPDARPWWEPVAVEHALMAGRDGRQWLCDCGPCEVARAGGWTPAVRAWALPQRRRLTVVPDAKRVSPDDDGAPRAAWHGDVEAFWKAFLGGRALPVALADGWSVAGLTADRVNRAVAVTLAGPEGARFEVLAEPKTSFPAMAATRWLSLCSGHVPRGVDRHNVVRPLVDRLAGLLGDREGGLAQADVDAIFGRPLADQEVLRGAELRINRECNERCVFCCTPPDADRILEGPAEVYAQIEREYRRNFRRITFTGRETTLDPNLRAYIASARQRGFEDIEVQTNATTFAHRKNLDALLEAGLTSVHVSLHTLDPEVFERIIGPAHLLQKTLAGLDHVAASPPLRCNLLCVVTRHNVGELTALVEQVAARWGGRVAFVLFSPMAPMGDGAKNLDALPPLAELGPAVARALGRAAELGVPARVPQRCGLPLCLMPPELYAFNEEFDATAGASAEQGKSKPPQCAGCRFEPRCGGVWTAYLDRFGADAIAPVR